MNGFIVDSNFWGDFKTGDNVCFNLRILELLYDAYNNPVYSNRKNYIIKPITLLLVSLIEAVIYDFIKRCRLNTFEGVTGISGENLNMLRNSKAKDRFDMAILIVKDANIFKSGSGIIYKELNNLRKVRNRIHIQNSKFEQPLNESELFTNKLKEIAEICAELIYKTISKYYSRPIDGYVDDLHFPWKEHLQTKYI